MYIFNKKSLKFNIQKININAPSPITSWQIGGETMETVTDLMFWTPKSLQMVTAAMNLKGERMVVRAGLPRQSKK